MGHRGTEWGEPERTSRRARRYPPYRLRYPSGLRLNFWYGNRTGPLGVFTST